MGKLVVSENVSLDGVIEGPTGADGFDRGGWSTLINDRSREEWATVEFEEALRAEALLLGRGTHAWFIRRGWAIRRDEWANRLRSLPKYVVSSSTLGGRGWDNSTVLNGDVVEEVSKLTHRLDGEIVVYGSGRLVPLLIEQDLVDELRLITYPIVVGAGQRLFGETSGVKPMRLLSVRTIGDDLSLHVYQTLRDA